MILTRRFSEFVNELLDIRDEEMIEKARWECWLHKVYDLDFGEYLTRLDNKPTGEVPNNADLEEIVRNSVGIMDGFCPFE